jgi:hypothetical protein
MMTVYIDRGPSEVSSFEMERHVCDGRQAGYGDHRSFRRATEIAAYRGNIMRPRKIIRTTVGELIVVVTDEVMPFVRDPSRLYLSAIRFDWS